MKGCKHVWEYDLDVDFDPEFGEYCGTYPMRKCSVCKKTEYLSDINYIDPKKLWELAEQEEGK